MELSGFDLPMLQPYVARYTGIQLLSGKFGSKLDIERDAMGRLTVNAETEVAGFRTVDNELRMDFVKWDRLSIAGIKYKSEPASLSIRSVRAQGPYARVIIDQNRHPEHHRGTAAGGHRAARGATASTRARAGGEEIQWHDAHGAAAAAGACRDMPLSIGTVVITNGSANYADQWIQPLFAIGIQQLNGTIDGLSSSAASRAKIDLKGRSTAMRQPISGGETNLLSQTTYTDISLSYKGIELTGSHPIPGGSRATRSIRASSRSISSITSRTASSRPAPHRRRSAAVGRQG